MRHRSRAGDHIASKRCGDIVTQGIGGGNDLRHERMDTGGERWAFEDGGGINAACHDGEAVEGDIPNQLIPARAP